MKMKMEKRTTKVVQIKKGCTFFYLGGSLPENGETSPRNNDFLCLRFTASYFPSLSSFSGMERMDLITSITRYASTKRR